MDVATGIGQVALLVLVLVRIMLGWMQLVLDRFVVLRSGLWELQLVLLLLMILLFKSRLRPCSNEYRLRLEARWALRHRHFGGQRHVHDIIGGHLRQMPGLAMAGEHVRGQGVHAHMGDGRPRQGTGNVVAEQCAVHVRDGLRAHVEVKSHHEHKLQLHRRQLRGREAGSASKMQAAAGIVVEKL